jgi:hypothetical protein
MSGDWEVGYERGREIRREARWERGQIDCAVESLRWPVTSTLRPDHDQCRDDYKKSARFYSGVRSARWRGRRQTKHAGRSSSSAAHGHVHTQHARRAVGSVQKPLPPAYVASFCTSLPVPGRPNKPAKPPRPRAQRPDAAAARA